MSHAFDDCCGLSVILRELESKTDTVPSTKPMAKKLSQLASRKKVAVAKAVAKKAAAKAAAPGNAAAKAAAAKAAVPGKAPPVAKAFFFVAPSAKCAAAPALAAAKAPAAKCAAAVVKAAAKAPAAKAAPAKAKNMTRKCVHSRAYQAAATKAKKDGLDAAEISKAACAAGKEANRQWDEQFGSESNPD